MAISQVILAVFNKQFSEMSSIFSSLKNLLHVKVPVNFQFTFIKLDIGLQPQRKRKKKWWWAWHNCSLCQGNLGGKMCDCKLLGWVFISLKYRLIFFLILARAHMLKKSNFHHEIPKNYMKCLSKHFLTIWIMSEIINLISSSSCF